MSVPDAPPLTQEPTAPEAEGFTIGQAAAFAGVTIETVQRYHQDGLCDEPEPDSIGRRRYRPAETLQLVSVRALAGAGVPTPEIRPLLDYLDHVKQLLSAETGRKVRHAHATEHRHRFE
ncbi:DNA-binding transcriptional MerR regulator [Nocardia tenerifensis]|uniref:DNA-binding transcriptional MerR regulator n=1 Tax=Nocardia tenerifensis TaxID=228006 RepID=A0A318KMM4_9NOCA|nr:MerR family transcriptional regulator [Nocardia tenerifensis]PXX70940.1 DNA-binding transcriptional MerR regulator [Nocardia tenerifensis]